MTKHNTRFCKWCGKPMTNDWRGGYICLGCGGWLVKGNADVRHPRA